MASLPKDLLICILCHLPVKPLLQFRAVSKSWRHLFDSPVFVHLHLKNSIGTGSNLALILQKDSVLYSVELDLLNDPVELAHPLMCYSHRIQVLGSCNGLLCIANVAEDIAFWNPAIRQHKFLPFLPAEPNKNSGSSYLGARVYGFGYDQVHDDHKLVRISQFINLRNDGFVSKVKVYSLRENELRDSEDMPYVLCYTKKNGTLASGCLHWVVNRKFKFDDADLIVAFDLTVERFREVPMPECAVEKFQIDVGVLGGCFCMVANYYDIHVDVWVMKEYGVKESWAKLFTVEQDVIFFGGTFKYLRPLAYSKSGEEVLLEQNHDRLVWYDLRKKKIKNVNLAGLPAPFEAHICVGSLVPAEVNREDNEKQQNLGAEKIKSKKRDDFLSKGFKLVL
ncbi:hypothetical protein I3760_10G077600 [Carya illinoinensis]|uniref:F-box domain-containing protein n=2 Tax=Carya illinoinensis TaxID=32201 RepID=A0A8T1PD91_CARIL|nr:F-box protein CPR1-like [Carya illinoinensis]KAG2684445.1 hypothetical protein I3760_10G077600 [Carya illinoinensis]KAG2684446.1 hypothetical protein I3760_10G077600 [Carya illinoinensis]KAG2684447.1 hypothetical protein I3760_10G077600 [Carya illinoinensis]KAG2684449.1 hypothetical protein I3760_10G077600 [Carya illinoinensis]KAG2684450.1 hypothetical protein I3760_10G077600 [Carya illinoinensis]